MGLGGFLSGLGKVVGKVAPMAMNLAVPGSGTAVSGIQKAIAGAGALGGTLGAMGDARAQGRAEQGAANLDRDRVALDAQDSRQRALLDAEKLRTGTATDAANLDLKQKQFGLDAPGQKLANAIRGGAAARMQDVVANRPGGVPNISFAGGMRPSLIGPAGREAGAEMERQALMSMLNPEKFADLPSAHPEVMSPFKLTEQPKAGLLDKIFGAAGTIGGVATGVSNAQDAIKKVIAGRGRVPLLPISGMPSALPGQNVALSMPQGPRQPDPTYGGVY